jgi:hypothetical protein
MNIHLDYHLNGVADVLYLFGCICMCHVFQVLIAFLCARFSSMFSRVLAASFISFHQSRTTFFVMSIWSSLAWRTRCTYEISGNFC